MDLALPDSHRLETLQLLRRAIDNGWDIPDVDCTAQELERFESVTIG